MNKEGAQRRHTKESAFCKQFVVHFVFREIEFREGSKVSFNLLNKKKEVYLNTAGLPELDAEEDYQLWGDVDGEMINMGLINVNSEELQPMAFIEGAESLNITLEPEGGSEEPTVTLLYVNGSV